MVAELTCFGEHEHHSRFPERSGAACRPELDIFNVAEIWRFAANEVSEAVFETNGWFVAAFMAGGTDLCLIPQGYPYCDPVACAFSGPWSTA
ncbi:MAG: hypothetical protein GEV28_24210 [Actinophytocola sp.]|uniref:hypothetical protein n=1 Tax=Actinophytocola sp. TaxID=1872138 RepID=UPI00132ACB56|nr:hypothetical protein [Actinophytocola sp.]MPZ83327.1 hypothetical protein [Actinophytocola sp.]